MNSLFRVNVERKVMLVFVQQVKINSTINIFLFNFDFIDCDLRSNSNAKDCLGSRINVERLAQSIRQLILDTKVQIYFIC